MHLSIPARAKYMEDFMNFSSPGKYKRQFIRLAETGTG